MARWKALPEELDPQVREFASQLRRLVDRSGLSVASVADRTGFSKTSWERYLNGRLLPPQRAVVALAEVTGTNPGHLTTLWELAERAWSRSEMRHDVTMEAIRVAQARAALGESGQSPDEPKPTWKAAGRPGRSAGGPVATAPQPPQPRSDQAPSGADFPGLAATTPPAAPAAPAPEPPSAGRGRTALMFSVGVVGALLVAVAAVLLLNPFGSDGRAAPKPSPTPSKKPVLPAGVKCSGADCAGQDPEEKGCADEHAVTAARGVAGGALIEVRYSKVCRAAWARITAAAQGDQATISAGDRSATARAGADGDAYTPMVEVTDASKVSACGTTVAGRKGCTQPVPGAPVTPRG
ncbi:helix-turn-helix domain-containing protein [Streptomyces halobius]|uniref:XRE family transcriptional regulator n=1 Tax=Streptomyces halobius TaxID=2879846 RepID=A0ABY4M843_9ACTN|nr:XRE family transcriptional regulator [Streptomyces halobius]UQA93498.1 XRE family transcriptional regulator [Streptomyces halobius]